VVVVVHLFSKHSWHIGVVEYLPAGHSAATSSLLLLSSVIAASQQESKVVMRRAFNIIWVLACLKDARAGKDLGAELTKQMMTTRRTIAASNLISMLVSLM
jgi:hypothetical protein